MSQNEIELGKAVALLTDAVLILDQYKVSPPLLKRISQFLDTMSVEQQIHLIRIGQD